MKRWRVTIEEPDGKGGRRNHTYGQRGPENEAESKAAAERDIIGTQTRRALRSGAKNPGLKFVGTEFVHEDNGDDVSPVLPAGARPVDLEAFSDKNADGTPKNSAKEALAKLPD